MSHWDVSIVPGGVCAVLPDAALRLTGVPTAIGSNRNQGMISCRARNHTGAAPDSNRVSSVA
jgi:hypothetical protein